MLKSTLIGGLAACAVVTASAKEYPLEFKTIKAADVVQFPGGYGTYGILTPTKPPDLKKAPKATSAHPLYGQLTTRDAGYKMVYQIDETKGTGKGYDRFILDLNENGDLTDDPVIALAAGADTAKDLPEGREEMLFGPIEVPPEKKIGDWRPIYFAQAYIYNRNQIASERISFIGTLRLRAGWYLETTVELDGIKRKVGVIDGNANLKLGDSWKPYTYTNTAGVSWYFRPADCYLQDNDGSGRFDNNPFGTETAPLGPILYFGAVPYKAALTADNRSLRIEPWTEPLAELTVEPNGEHVHSVALAWEKAKDQWELIEPVALNGKLKVPPGNHRLYSTVLTANAAADNQVMVSGYYRKPDRTFGADAAKPGTLRCGTPLELKVTTERLDSKDSQYLGLLSRLLTRTGEDSDWVLKISATAVGVADETYASFAKGKSLTADAPQPVFKVMTADGKTVASGNMEFG